MKEFAGVKGQCSGIIELGGLIRIGFEQLHADQLVPALQYPPTPSSVNKSPKVCLEHNGTRNSEVV